MEIILKKYFVPLALAHFFKKLGGGGGPKTKKAKDILRFSRQHDLFCSFLFSV